MIDMLVRVCTLKEFNRHSGCAGTATVSFGANASGGVAMNPLAVIGAPIGAVIGGVIGAGIWAGIAIGTHYELSLIAILVGALVGAGSAVLGGRGVLNAMLCAAIALAAILAGKIISYQYIFSHSEEAAAITELGFTEDVYLEMVKDAKDLLKVSDEASKKVFIASHGYSESEMASEVTEEEIRNFDLHNAPFLREMAESRMKFDEWKGRMQKETFGTASVTEGILGNLDFKDYLFAFFGILAAFQAGYKGLAGLSES